MTSYVWKWKEFVFGFLAAASGVGAFWLWHQMMPLAISGKIHDLIGFITPLAALLIAASLYSLSAIFIENLWILYPAAVAGVLIPFFFISATNVVITVSLISLLLLYFSLRKIYREMSLSLGFSAVKILHAGLPLYFTVVSLLISMYYLAYFRDREPVAVLLPKPVFEYGLKLFEGPLKDFTGLPEIRPEATIDEILGDAVLAKLKENGVRIPIAKNQISSFVAAQRTEFSKQFGIRIKGDERVSDLFYNLASERIGDIAGPYRPYLPYVSAAAFFFAFKTLSILLYFATVVIVLFLIHLLRAVKILKSEKREIEIERLTL